VLQACSRRGVAYIAAGAFNGGMLARDVSDKARFNYRLADATVISEHSRLSRIASRCGISLKAAALQFVLRHPQVCSLVTGTATEAEVEENVRLSAIPIPEEFWALVA
jgi:D-threo-aldose 1-dehydrogenase